MYAFSFLHLLIYQLLHESHVHTGLDLMLPKGNSAPKNRKRQLFEDSEPTPVLSPPPPAKRRKREHQQPHRRPGSFWDNLSRQWLTRHTLREFDQRTVSPAIPLPSNWSGQPGICLPQLKCFARHGGPNLGDLRAVDVTHIFPRAVLIIC